MMPAVLAPENTAFLVAIVLLVLLAISQLIGLGDMSGDADFDFNADMDAHADFHAGVGIGDAIASLLGLGKLPLMAWLTLATGCFAMIGLAIQQFAHSMTGALLPALPASGFALLAAVPAAAVLARPLGRIWPKDETSAIHVDALLAKRGRIQIGRAARGSPARAAVRDQHGTTHLVMVEPHLDGTSFAAGEEVLLVRREGETFFAVACDPPLLADAD